MKFLRPLKSRQASDAWIDFQIAHQSAHGFCLWAVEEKSSGRFVGAIGLLRADFCVHFTPAVEVGWRLARNFWGQGFAVEAASAALQFGFDELDVAEIVAFAGVFNAQSRRVMDKLGMSYDPRDDFDHPRIPVGDPLRPHVLYRLSSAAWRRTTTAAAALRRNS